LFDASAFSLEAFSDAAWLFEGGFPPEQPVEDDRLYPGAFAPIGSSSGRIRINRRRARRELDLLIFGR
jgi:hypothetical protein